MIELILIYFILISFILLLMLIPTSIWYLIKKRYSEKKSLIIFTGCLTLVVIICILFYFLPSSSPEKAIGKYVFICGDLFKKYDLKIDSYKETENPNVYMFYVYGYVDGLGMGTPYFTVKKTNFGWYVLHADTGP